MKRYIPVTEYIRKLKWCKKHGWTEPYYNQGKWYGFPPNAVIAQEIPWTKWELIGFLSIHLLLVVILSTILSGGLFVVLSISIPSNTLKLSGILIISVILAASFSIWYTFRPNS